MQPIEAGTRSVLGTLLLFSCEHGPQTLGDWGQVAHEPIMALSSALPVLLIRVKGG